jgi:CRISPR system Cascade subunit CasA
MSLPGLLIVEAPMGEGKTEAALAAAEVLAARSGAGGVLISLPTRATSDGMFPRLLAWLEHLPVDGPRSVVLAHAKAALNDLWAGLVREGRREIRAVELDGSDEVRTEQGRREAPAGLHAHQWLRGRKKSLLASFAVGTIDQVLFAGLKSRHLALRHLAVAGKVVVIDEVHAYDAYMSRYLERVLEWLSAYGVPVILLSATLPAGRRRALAMAYGGSSQQLAEVPHDTYPLLTAVGQDSALVVPLAGSGRRTEVLVERLPDEVPVLADRLAEELRDGGCALVVRNTVDRVLETADRLRERFGDATVTVAHSRFLAADRAARDVELLTRFGPGGDRPDRHIVVASQVVEQSLDIDFDILVCDLAPIDLVLQRMGRLHRHDRERPGCLRRPRCLITGVDWEADPPVPIRGSRSVYQGDHVLLRAMAVLRPYLEGRPVILPDDISPLVQDAYSDLPIGPDSWAGAMSSAAQKHQRLLAHKKEKAEAFLIGPVRRAGRPLFSWLEAHAGDADDSRTGRAQVRDSEESLEVLVVQRTMDGRLRTVPWLDGGRGGLELPEHTAPSRNAAEAVAASALTLPWQFSRPQVIESSIAELRRNHIDAWQAKGCPWVAGELILVLDEKCQTRLGGSVLRYSPADGLRVVPPDQQDPDHPTATVEEDHMAQESRESSFELTSRPWLPVQRVDGTVAELSLIDVFRQAADIRRLVGDVPTQDLALLRLLLAIAHDALDGPRTVDDWAELWNSGTPFALVPDYLERHSDRFDLLHTEQPFFQVAGLRTEKGDVSSLNRIVADVPNGEPFFAMRHPGVERLSYAEAARWLIHTHAFDPSGIKSGMEGDSGRSKNGKVYPLGVGSAGSLGGTVAEGGTLRETLLLNLVALDEGIIRSSDGDADAPAWRRPQNGPGPRNSGPPVPTGIRDLYTWQSRRVLLHHDGRAVTGVVLGYGDPLDIPAPWKLEPMTAWRRSPAQEKKQGKPLWYTPRPHDPARAAWRGLASLLAAQRSRSDDAGTAPAETLPSGIVRWLTMLTTEGELGSDTPVRVRLTGAVYGTQQSVIDEIVDDSLLMSVVLLHEERPQFRGAALGAVADADSAVAALGELAGNLAAAAGREPGPAADAARAKGFGALDGPYRRWLATLNDDVNPGRAREEWRDTVRSTVNRLGAEEVAGAGAAASEGRMVRRGQRETWIDDSLAQLWFWGRLRKALPRPVSPPVSA